MTPGNKGKGGMMTNRWEKLKDKLDKMLESNRELDLAIMPKVEKEIKKKKLVVPSNRIWP